jgi:iron complex outermembrane recepter protein
VVLTAVVGGPFDEGAGPTVVMDAFVVRGDADPVYALGFPPIADTSFRTARGPTADLALLPGMLLQPALGDFDPPRLAVRGGGLNSAPSGRGLLIMVDDLPVTRADGIFHSGLLNPFAAAQVTLQPGTAAGAPALGGMLRMVSGVQTAPQDTLRSQLAVGSHGYAAAAAQAAMNGVDTALFVADSTGWRPHSDQQRLFVQLGFEVAAAPASGSLRLGIEHSALRYAVAGPLTSAALYADPRQLSTVVQRDMPYRESYYTQASAFWQRTVGVASHQLGWSLAQVADDFRQLRPNGVRASRGFESALVWQQARPFTLGVSDHLLRSRLLILAGRGVEDRWRNDAGSRGLYLGSLRTAAHTAVLTVEDRWQPSPRLRIDAALGIQHTRRAIAPLSASVPVGLPPVDDLAIDGVSWLPRFEIGYNSPAGGTWFVRWSRAREAPGFAELVTAGSNPNLPVISVQPLADQRAITFEFGWMRHGQLPAFAGAAVYEARVTAFHGVWHNEWLRLADTHGSALGTVNAGPTVHQGVETAARVTWQLPVGWSVAAWLIHTWTDCRFERDPIYQRNRLAGIPPHVGGVGLRVAAGDRWSAALRLDGFWGATFVDYANSLAYAGHGQLHGEWQLALGAGWRLDVQGLNITGRRSVAGTAGVLDLVRNPAATAVFLPTPPRAIRLTVGRTW